MIITDPSRQEELEEWLCARFKGKKSSTPVVYVGNEVGGRLVAVAAFNNYTNRTVFIHIAGEGKGNWFTRDFRWYIFWYPFTQLGVDRLIAPIEFDNKRCLVFAQHLGFEEMFTKETVRVFSMVRARCKWLKEN